MSLNKNTRVCTHIKVNGVRCGSPALRGEVFCYFHQRMIRGIATPPKSRLHPIAQIEDAESIQTSLMEVINTLVRNTIDFRRAQLILRALNIAASNRGLIHFESEPGRGPRRNRKNNVSAIELPAGQQVERRREHPYPGGNRRGV